MYGGIPSTRYTVPGTSVIILSVGAMVSVHGPRWYRCGEQPLPEHQSGVYIYIHLHQHIPSKIKTSDDKDTMRGSRPCLVYSILSFQEISTEIEDSQWWRKMEEI